MPEQSLYLRGLAYTVGDAVPLADIEPAFRVIQRHRVTNLWSDLRGHG